MPDRRRFLKWAGAAPRFGCLAGDTFRRAAAAAQVASMTMQPCEELIVGRRQREILNAARKAARA